MKKYMLWPLTAILLILFSLQGVNTTWAQMATPQPPIISEPPLPLARDFDGLTIKYQRVNVTIENQVATTHIDQLFVNNNDWVLEGMYLFPLPDGAAVSQLTMWVDGHPIEAKILERDEAQQIYDTIVRQLRDPALLKYVGSAAVEANIFPIPPHDERRVEIEYTQVLPVDNGVVHYLYPQATDLYTNAPLDNQSIRVEVRSNEAIHAVYSPSHSVAINREGDFHVVAGYEATGVTADQDFELYYTVSPENIGLNLLSYREAGQDGFFLLMVAPSVAVDEVVARDVILVIDTSGSMEGEKLQQVKEASLYVVEHLNPGDRFNIISFSTGVRSYQSNLVSAANPGDYTSFINSLEALGGTNISQALLEAANLVNEERPTTIIFLTDGLATEGITDTPLLLQTVAQAMHNNARLFAFGVGDDVDPTLLDSLAQTHRGTTTYVRPFQSIDEEVSSFYAKVSTPVLSDISLDFGGITVEQMYPPVLPDLFAGSQLILVGRYREGGPATVTLQGMVNGREQVFTFPDNFFRSHGGDDFIPRLWATRAIGHLLTEIRLRGEEPELIQSIVNLSIRYGIITPYTSYLIEEDDIFSQTARQTIVNDVISQEAEGAPPAVSEMVEEAAASADMAAAEVPMPLPTIAASAAAPDEQGVVESSVRFVGSKTFILRDGVWIDTAFDSDRHTPRPVVFATEAYFDLLSSTPELGQYLAIDQRVLVVYEDMAYEIVVGQEESVFSTLPAGSSSDVSVTTIPNEISSNEAAVTPVPMGIPPTSSSNLLTSSLLLLAVVMIPLLLGLGFWIDRRGAGR